MPTLQLLTIQWYRILLKAAAAEQENAITSQALPEKTPAA